MKYCFGVDVGGTTVKLGLFTVEGELLDKWEIKTYTENEGERILPDVAEAIKGKIAEKLLKAEEICGIGVGVPAPVDKNGAIERAANVGWMAKEIKKELEELTGFPCVIGNDANVAALGEMWKGAGEGEKDLIMVTLGTGVGGGIIIDGHAVVGAHGAGGEIGHITVRDDETEACGCGRKGCLEQYASATGLVRLAKKYYKPVVDDGEEKDFNRKNSGKKITVKAHKTTGSNNIYLSDKVKLKRKQFHKFDKNVTKIYEMLGQSKSENKPAICILSPEEMGKNAVATYIPTDNVLNVNSAYFITKNLAELQKPFACPDSELSSVLHELIHWQDAEKYRQKFGEITDYNAYCDYLNKIYAPKVEKLIKSGYNISDISEYAKLEFRKNEFDEVHAEFCVKQLLQR